jgi:hypothetical protein
MTRSRIVIVLLLVLAVFGCSRLKDIFALRSGIVKEFGTENVTVTITNGEIMTVAFVNSPFTDQSREEQGDVARRVADYVREHYADFDSLDVVYVTFGTRRSAGCASYSETGEPFRFTPYQLMRSSVEAPSRSTRPGRAATDDRTDSRRADPSRGGETA